MIVRSTDEPASLGGDWIVALGFCGVVALVASIAFAGDRFSGESLPKWITGAFFLCGVIMVWRAALRTVGALKFGRIRLHLPASPARVGGTLEGELDFPRKASSLKDVVATLVCIRTRWTTSSGPGSSGGPTRTDEDIWKAQQRLDLVVDGQRGRASIHIGIPGDLPDSRTRSSDPWKLGPSKTFEQAWELRLNASAPGVDLVRRFPIDVLP